MEAVIGWIPPPPSIFRVHVLAYVQTCTHLGGGGGLGRRETLWKSDSVGTTSVMDGTGDLS